jgi:hypothetical protein
MFACRYADALDVPRVCGVNMRFNLEYWRDTFKKNVAEKGHWTLVWKNRGQPIKHTVSVSGNLN